MERIKQYFENSTVHGFRYIAESERHWTERLFWITACCLSGYYTWFYIIATWHAFQTNAVSFVVETDYLHWNTTFPAVTVCEQESPDKINEVANELFGAERDGNLDFFIRDIAFHDGTCASCSDHCLNGNINCTENFKELVKKIRVGCDDLLEKCVWNGVEFDCCKNFLPLPTEFGLCFSLNSIHTKKKDNGLPKLISNKQIGAGILEVNAYESVKIYIHSMEDVPYVNHPQDDKALLNWGSTYIMKIKVKEIENDRNLPLVKVEQRNCRLPEENFLDVYNYYSFTACVVNCRARAQMKLCNCTSHFIPFKDKESEMPTCGIAGLICLTQYSEIIRKLRVQDLKFIGIDCKCVSSCTEPEYSTIFSDTQINTKKVSDPNSTTHYGSRIIISLDKLPIERYKRNVVRTRLDLVVSVGGTVGLFLGASILSFLELIYYVCIRMHTFDVKRIKNIEGTDRNRKGVKKFISQNLDGIPRLLLPNFRRRV